MQKTFFSLLALLAVVLMAWAYSWNDIQAATSSEPVTKPMLNVVRDVEPVRSNGDVTQLVEKLRTAESDVQRSDIMTNEGQAILTPYISAYLRGEGYTCYMNPVEFFFGSGTSDNVSSGDKKFYAGLYENELYAKVTGGECFGEKGIVVYAACSNLTLYKLLKPETEIVLGSGAEYMQFVVQEGSGFDVYTRDFETSIDLAEYFHLPVYKGKTWKNETKITYDQARSMANYLSAEQVTIGNIFPGDVVDLGNMTINGIPANKSGNYRT